MSQKFEQSKQDEAVALLLKEFAEVFSAPEGSDPLADKAAIHRLTSNPVIGGAIDNMMSDLKESVCDSVEDALLETVDTWSGAVDPSKLDLVNAAHFARCGDCQAFAADMSILLDYPEAREAIAEAAEEFVNERAQSQTESAPLSVRATDLATSAAANLQRTGQDLRKRSATILRFPTWSISSLDMAVVRDGSVPHAKSIQQSVDDPDGRWTLRYTAFPAESGNVTSPKYRVELELLKFGEIRRWRDARWELTATLRDRSFETQKDDRGIMLLGDAGDLFSLEDLSEIDFAVELLD